MKAFIKCFSVISLSLISAACTGPANKSKAEAAIQRIKDNTVKMYYNNSPRCSAVVINQRYALTAAHCIPERQPSFREMFGLGGDDSGGQEEAPLNLFIVKNGVAIPVRPVFSTPGTDSAVLEGNFEGFHNIGGTSADLTEALVFTEKEALFCGYPGELTVLVCIRGEHIKNEGFGSLYSNTVLPGMSGGAVISLRGVLMGRILAVSKEDGYAVAGTTTGVSDVEKSKDKAADK